MDRGRGVKRNILERYEKDEYLEKVNVAPGMTSLYVIEGRSDLSSREWVRLVLDPIKNIDSVRYVRGLRDRSYEKVFANNRERAHKGLLEAM